MTTREDAEGSVLRDRPRLRFRNDALEIEGGLGAASSVLLTCEHASERLPEPWRWTDADRARLLGTHWAFDLGAATLTRELAASLDAVAVLSRYSRLLIDPNRPLDSPTLFRPDAEGQPVELNRDVSAEDRERRVESCWRPYHDAIDGELRRRGMQLVLGIHTFTPVYEGSRRALEVGVLFDRDEAPARRFVGALAEVGFRAALNEPYSGQEGMMYSVDHHARRHGAMALEIELRQDLAVDADARARVVRALTEVLR